MSAAAPGLRIPPRWPGGRVVDVVVGRGIVIVVAPMPAAGDRPGTGGTPGVGRACRRSS